MKQIKIDINEHNQRIDRFLKKYFSKATNSFIYKMLRKKRIKLNGARANPEDIIVEGDMIDLYLSDETIEKFREEEKEIKKTSDLDIVYEDENIVLINKPKGMLSHSSDNYHEKNIVDELVSYLYNKGEYIPRRDKTFTPSICNRLDRNTSGMIIGAKNYNALKEINNSLKNRYIGKYYKTIVRGNVEGQSLSGYLTKNDKNRVSITKDKLDNSKEIITNINVLKKSKDYSLLEIELITGRTHQIRAHLSSIKHPIIGDTKYGDKRVNEFFKGKYKLNSQYLHAYKLVFNNLKNGLEYLNKKEFVVEENKSMKDLEKELFE